MYAVEIEEDIKQEFIKVPEFDKFNNKHVKIIFMTDSTESIPLKKNKYKLDDLFGKLNWEGDAVKEQRRLRDEW